jgi:HPt (histidine-containing phosphotransfer) domain-containing protein
MPDFEALQALGLHTDEGLACCADDPEFYEEMLAEYAAEAPARIATLREQFDAADWKNYGISAHSAKSTSRMIGALVLSERAKELEFAAKANDAETIRGTHEPFLRDCELLAGQLEKLLGGAGGTP